LDRNLILAVVLSMLVFTTWSAYQAKFNPAPDPTLIEGEQLADGAQPESDAREGAEAASTEAATAAAETGAQSATLHDDSVADAQWLDDDGEATSAIEPWTGEIRNDVASGALSNRGAAFTEWHLKDYFKTPREEEEVELLNLQAPYGSALVTPFEDLGVGDLGNAVYAVEYANDNEAAFLLERRGVRVRKIYRQVEGEYGFHLEIQIENGTDRVLSPDFKIIWPAIKGDLPEHEQLSLVALTDGDVERELVVGLGSPGFLGGLFGGGDEGPPHFRNDVVWAGTDLKYFAGLLVPPEGVDAEVVFETLDKGKSGAVVMSLPPTPIVPGETLSRSFQVFLGPKEPELLVANGNDFELSIDRGYSWVSPLTGFFEKALHIIHGFIPNYGLAIIVLTLLVRVATLPIMAKQMKSAEKMREVMPAIKELQEKFKDDKQKQSEETFKLYREEGVNPLAGCFPMVLQLPVFIGLFFALQSSIELRHAPFALWINDLSAPATLFTIPGLDFPVRLLPLLMGASMFVQQKMTPQTGMDPAQAKMMLIMMPGMMLFISYTFPSGLVLYWTVSNLLGIGHQLWVRKRMHANDKAEA
jgi:YidC/Oxa1 family membrane protein insertase